MNEFFTMKVHPTNNVAIRINVKVAAFVPNAIQCDQPYAQAQNKYTTDSNA